MGFGHYPLSYFPAIFPTTLPCFDSAPSSFTCRVFLPGKERVGSVRGALAMMVKKHPEYSTQNRRNDSQGAITNRYDVPSRGLFMKQLRVLMASAEELAEPIFRKTIEEGSHHLTILNPYEKKGEFLAEAKSGGYDVIVLTNLGSPLDYSMGLISLLRLACTAKVIVMSGVADRRKGPPRKGGVPFYLFPMSGKQILKAVEKAAGMSESSR